MGLLLRPIIDIFLTDPTSNLIILSINIKEHVVFGKFFKKIFQIRHVLLLFYGL